MISVCKNVISILLCTCSVISTSYATSRQYLSGSAGGDRIIQHAYGIDTQQYLQRQQRLQGEADIRAMRNSPEYHKVLMAGLSAGLPHNVAIALADQRISDASGLTGTYQAYGDAANGQRIIDEATQRYQQAADEGDANAREVLKILRTY